MTKYEELSSLAIKNTEEFYDAKRSARTLLDLSSRGFGSF
jgi:hypothetical protein